MSIPASDPNDSEDVVLALETAEALWNKGDPGEALRWLRRAAEAAGDSGDDMRAVVLAKAVADLNAAGSDAAPKQVRPPPLPPQAAAKADAQPEAQGVDESPLSARGGLKGVSKAPPPPPSARKSQVPPKPAAPPSGARSSKPAQEAAAAAQEATSGEAETAPQKKMNPPPTPAKKSSTSSKTEGEPVAATDAGAPSLTRPPTKSVKNRSSISAPGRSSVSPGSKVGPASTPGATRSGKKRSFARAALRVYVTTKDQEGERLEVFVLNEGQRPPAGAVEALLVPLRRGAKLLR